jgi:hypothetical protein
VVIRDMAMARQFAVGAMLDDLGKRMQKALGQDQAGK